MHDLGLGSSVVDSANTSTSPSGPKNSSCSVYCGTPWLVRRLTLMAPHDQPIPKTPFPPPLLYDNPSAGAKPRPAEMGSGRLIEARPLGPGAPNDSPMP
ncbi:hypothetical protein D3C78_1648090 [compost metagenome]